MRSVVDRNVVMRRKTVQTCRENYSKPHITYIVELQLHGVSCTVSRARSDGFGGLVVSVLASVFRKIHSTPSYGGEVK
jgi:galactokinase